MFGQSLAPAPQPTAPPPAAQPDTTKAGSSPLLAALGSIIGTVAQHLNSPKPPASSAGAALLAQPPNQTKTASTPMPNPVAPAVPHPPVANAAPAAPPTLAQQMAQNYAATGALLNSPYETMPEYKPPAPLGMSKGVKWGSLALALAGLLSRNMTGVAGSALGGLEKGRETVEAKREKDAQATYEATAAKVSEANKVHQQKLQDLIAQSGVLEKQKAAADAAAAKTAALGEKVREFNGRLGFDKSKFATSEADKIAEDAKKLDVALQMRGMADDTRMAVETASVNAAQSRLAASLLNSSLLEASRSHDASERVYGQIAMANTRAYTSKLQQLGSQANALSHAIAVAKDDGARSVLQAQLGAVNDNINGTNAQLNSAMSQHVDPKGKVTYTVPSVDFGSVYAPPTEVAQPGQNGGPPVVVEVQGGGGTTQAPNPNNVNLTVNANGQPQPVAHPPVAAPPAPVHTTTAHSTTAHAPTPVPITGGPPPDVVNKTLTFLKSRQPWQQPQYFNSYPKPLQDALIAAGYDPTGLGHGVAGTH